MQGHLESLGIRNPRQDWESTVRNWTAGQVENDVKRRDLRTITRGGLSWKVIEGHNCRLNMVVMVQIEDVINIGQADPRNGAAPCTLQFVLSDGGQEFVGFEWRSLRDKQLGVRTKPGTKLQLSPQTRVHRGRVLLEPSSVNVFVFPAGGTDIWGPEGEKRRLVALNEAGLPVPNTSTFDTIAAQGPVRPMGLTDQAIAEGGDREEDEDDDLDSAFWAAAVEAADNADGTS